MSSTAPSGRSSRPPSSGETIGSAPRKHGLPATASPSTTRWCTDTWWPAEAPRPGAGAGRVAEDPQVVHARITAALAGEAGGEPLGAVEDVLQTHDRRGADVRRLGQPRREQAHRRALLVGPLLVDRQPAVVGGRVVPAQPLDVGGVRARPRPDAGGALLVVEAVDPRGGRLGHGRGDRARGRGGRHLIRCSWVITSPSAPPTQVLVELAGELHQVPVAQVRLEVPGARPVLVEEERGRVVDRDVQVVVDAAVLGQRRLDELLELGAQLLLLAGQGGHARDDRRAACGRRRWVSARSLLGVDGSVP